MNCSIRAGVTRCVGAYKRNVIPASCAVVSTFLQRDTQFQAGRFCQES